jgi:hypothetical protein
MPKYLSIDPMAGKYLSTDPAAGKAVNLQQREAIVAPVIAGAQRRSNPLPGDPEFYGDPNAFESIRQAGMHRGTAGAAGPTAAILGSAAIGPVVGGATGIPGVIGGAARFVAARPNVAAGTVAAVPELLHGDVKGAVGTGATTALGLKGGSKFLQFLGRFKGGGSAAKMAEKIVKTESAEEILATARKRAIEEGIKKGHFTREQIDAALRQAAEAPKAATAPILRAGQRAMATNLGGKAKPGPPPTAPDKLEETLKKSLDAISKKEASVFQAPRIEVGAQRVGKAVGMTKEQVRLKAGPVLDEALGEASPILPKEPLKKIIDTMRKIPVAEREAYVARATSGKAKAQIENIRRTLEHLGLLLPVGAVAASRQEK